jgi:hypothetical protein
MRDKRVVSIQYAMRLGFLYQNRYKISMKPASFLGDTLDKLPGLMGGMRDDGKSV